jgi:hypothetical protein
MSKNDAGIGSTAGQLIDYGRSHGLRGLPTWAIVSTLTASTWLFPDGFNLGFRKRFGSGWGGGVSCADCTVDTW